MTNSNINPWSNMQPSSIRRIDPALTLDFFWMTDERGKYGMHIKSDVPFDPLTFDVSLKGITVFKRTVGGTYGEVFLILNRNEDWELFLALCTDLVNTCREAASRGTGWMRAINIRLKRWQYFLKQHRHLSIPLETQMGLYGELSYLRDHVLPSCSPEESIQAWTGPDFDKQDFSLQQQLVEVKSYLSSKGQEIHISSLHQLDNSIKPLILVSYGITRTERGVSIQMLIEDIAAVLYQAGEEVYESFWSKLTGYGYMQNVSEKELYKFSTDKVRFFSVTDAFPKILTDKVHPFITSVRYIIDLSRCTEFEINPA